VQKSRAQECITLSNANWSVAANWSCDGVNRLPTCGDTVKIQSGHTITVSNQYNLQGCGAPIILDVTGILEFTNENKLELPCNSVLSIQTGGIVRKATAGGGTSTLISICSANVWTAGDGPLNGPISYGGEILPVELLSFSGKLINDFAMLNWVTATEQNSDYFSVYCSDDGKDWTLVEDVLAAGNSNIENYYTSTVYGIHDKVLMKLEQTDFDGTIAKLGLIELQKSNEPISQNALIYPNPVVNSLNFGGFPEGFEGEFSMHEINGRMVYKRPISTLDITIDISQLGLSPGVFIASVYSDWEPMLTSLFMRLNILL